MKIELFPIWVRLKMILPRDKLSLSNIHIKVLLNCNPLAIIVP